MRVLNQFFAENLERDYPFVAGAAIGPRVFADAVFRISAESGLLASAADAIALTALTEVSGNTLAVFTVTGGAFTGYTFQGMIPASPALYQRVRLDLYDTGAALVPGEGYGYVTMGDAVVPRGAFSVPVEAAAVRYTGADASFSLQLANANCPGDTQQSESVGTPVVTNFNTRTAVVTTRCVEISTNPLDQLAMVPDPTGAATVPTAIPIPVIPVTSYQTDAVVALTAWPLTVSDVLPPDPGYAAAPIGASGPGAVLQAGYNILLRGSLAKGAIQIGYQLGAGAGLYCGAVPGCPPGVLSSAALKSINGVTGEAFNFIAGPAIGLIASPGDHTLYVLVHPEDLSSATA